MNMYVTCSFSVLLKLWQESRCQTISHCTGQALNPHSGLLSYFFWSGTKNLQETTQSFHSAVLIHVHEIHVFHHKVYTCYRLNLISGQNDFNLGWFGIISLYWLKIREDQSVNVITDQPSLNNSDQKSNLTCYIYLK